MDIPCRCFWGCPVQAGLGSLPTKDMLWFHDSTPVLVFTRASSGFSCLTQSMSHGAPSLKHALDVSKPLLHFVHLKIIKVVSLSFKFLPCFCCNSITINHRFEADKHNTPSGAHNTPAEAHLHFLPLTGSDGANWWCKSFVLKNSWRQWQMRRRKAAKSGEPALLQFHQKPPAVRCYTPPYPFNHPTSVWSRPVLVSWFL